MFCQIKAMQGSLRKLSSQDIGGAFFAALEKYRHRSLSLWLRQKPEHLLNLLSRG